MKLMEGTHLGPGPRVHGAALALLAALLLARSAAAAPPAPSGPHPRIFLGPATLSAIKARASEPSSAAARVISLCDSISKNPAKFSKNDNWAWSVGAPTCGLAWRMTGDPKHAAAGISMLDALLDDESVVGDGGGGDAVIRSDSGYYIRIYAPYAALGYDWLWDAPGMDEAKRSHARARFQAWIDWYDAKGYLSDVPGSNYEAGYVFSKTLIAIAEGGEGGAASDGYWASLVDKTWTKQIVGAGLGPGGPMLGGDWPEGWQYGGLSVLEYSLGARALAEQGVVFPELAAFASDIVVRYRHAMLPAADMQWVGSGDFDDNSDAHGAIQARPLLAVLAGPSSDEAAGYAAFLRQTIAKDNDLFPFLDALAEARGATPVDYAASSPPPPLWTVVKGTRTVLARSGWDASAFWGVFTAAPRLVPDHQHPDASNLAFSRGSDHLIIDSSPYGSLSTLTSNALSVESNSVGKTMKPSQSFAYSKADLAFARSTASGIVAARADLAGAFAAESTPSDVPYARRDWAFLPDGELVLIDRARTDDPARGMLFRLRSSADFTTDATGARATVGQSTLDIRAVLLSPSVSAQARHVAPDKDACFSTPTYGVCDAARVDVGEYSLRLPGPSSSAVHVLSGLAMGEAQPSILSINEASIDPALNPQVIGASVHRGTTHTFVVASSAKDGASGASLSYVVPASGASHHVVFDAPEDSNGKSNVVAVGTGGLCTITITAGGETPGSPVIFVLGDGTDPCKIVDDAPNVAGGTPSGAGGGAGGGGAGGAGAGGSGAGAGASGDGAAAGDGADDGGCACTAATSTTSRRQGAWLFLALTLLWRRRRRGEPGSFIARLRVHSPGPRHAGRLPTRPSSGSRGPPPRPGSW
jgi:MYXO-CTERM domain-containing protein